MALGTKIADLTKDYQNLINTLFSSNYMVRQGLSNILNELAAEDEKEDVSEIYLIDSLNDYLTNPVFSRDGIKEDPIGINTINTKYNEEIAAREQADIDESHIRANDDSDILNILGVTITYPEQRYELYACVWSGSSWRVPSNSEAAGAKILGEYFSVMDYITVVTLCNMWLANAKDEYKLTTPAVTESCVTSVTLDTSSTPNTIGTTKSDVLKTLGSTKIAFMQNGGSNSNDCSKSTEVEIGSSQALSMCLLGAYAYDSSTNTYSSNTVNPAVF